MGKVIASYLVKVTIRQSDPENPDLAIPERDDDDLPTVQEIVNLLENAVADEFLDSASGESVNVTAERTDR